MCSARAVVLMSLVGTVLGCGSIQDHCKLVNGSIEVGKKITTGTHCPSGVMHPQLFQGHVSTKDGDELELFVYSRYSNDGHNKTVVPRTKITTYWNHPSAPCIPLNKCYIGDGGFDELHIEIACTKTTKGACEVDYSIALGCGNNGKQIMCTWTDWSPCAQGAGPKGNCTQNRFSNGPYNGGPECQGAAYRQCECPTHSPTHHPTESTDAPTTAPPTRNPSRPGDSSAPTQSPSHPGDTSPPVPITASPSSSPSGSPQAPSGSSSHTGAIVGGVLGGIAGVALIGAIIYFVTKKGAASASTGAGAPLVNEQGQAAAVAE
eukprot:Hpha_TRINITY_DN16495_c0_g2::TRINITY_DN16495_c0_g2_i1::g.159793::m.159793